MIASLHVRSMGKGKNQPEIVLLSGPNKNFHSDSAWFALLQNQLAKSWRVHAIDRPGNTWSDFDPETSYVQFTDVLHRTLLALEAEEVILVAFASANVTTRLFEQKYGDDKRIKIKGQVWIDPDVFMPHSIAMYQDYPVTWYREKLDQLLPYLATGAWTERTLAKIEAERETVASLISPANQSLMDWDYFDRASKLRLQIPQQQTRALEIAHYHTDLNMVKGLDFITATPVTVIDGDFEQHAIDSATDADEKARLTQWMTEGTEWSKQVAAKSGGQYIAVEDAHHLADLSTS